MLQNIRDNSQGIIAKSIIGLIVVIFAAAGVESLLGNGGVVAAAEINGEELSAFELDQLVRQQKGRILESMGENANPALLDDDFIKNSAMEQLIEQKLLTQSASQLGVIAAPMAVDELILSMAQFQIGGQFSPQQYENVLRSNGYTTSRFKDILADDLAIRQYTSGMVGSGFITEQQLTYAASIIGQQRSFDYIELSISDELNKAEVSNAEIEQFYHANIDQYQREAKSKLSYIEVKQADLVVPASEEDVLAAYQLEISDFKADEERKVSHILLELSDSRDEAQATFLALELKAKIAAGESFSAVAEAHSDDSGSASNGGDLGYSRGGSFPEDFDSAMSSAELNVVSGPVVTDAGVHLILVTDIKGIEKPSFEDRRLAISQRIELDQAEVAFVSRVEQLRDLVFNSADLLEPATELGLTVKQSSWIGQSDQAGVLTNPVVLKAAFSDEVLKDGNNSEVLEIKADHFIVVRVLEHKEIEPKPLAQVTARITAQLKKTKASEVLKSNSEQLLAQLKSGELAFSKLADNPAYTVISETQVSRSSSTAGRELSRAIFGMARPGVDEGNIASVSLSSGNQVIVHLHQVVDGNWQSLSEPEQKAIRMQLNRANSSQSIGALQHAIRGRAEITLL